MYHVIIPQPKTKDVDNIKSTPIIMPPWVYAHYTMSLTLQFLRPYFGLHFTAISLAHITGTRVHYVCYLHHSTIIICRKFTKKLSFTDTYRQGYSKN